MITDGAGVIRPTFYKHFQDKYELIEWIVMEQIIRPAAPLIENGMFNEAVVLMFTSLEKVQQSIASGKTVPAGTTVTITVSLGAETVSYKFSKSYSDEGAVSASYTLTGSDGVTYDSGEVDGSSVTVSASDMECESGTVTITWEIETVDEEGVSSGTTTKTETHNVSFSKQ